MQQEFSAIESSIAAFVEQPDDPTLVLGMSDNDVVPVLKMLYALDERIDDAVFLNFPFPCDAVEIYAQACMESLSRQIDDENRMRDTRGETPWPLLPMTSTDPRRAPAERLRSAVTHVRTLILDGATIVWSWVPSSLGDAEGFSKMMLDLFALNGFEDWMDGHRFCVRDDAARPFLIPSLQGRKAEHVLIVSVDLSSQKAIRQLVGVANDEAEPIERRMGALLQVAAVDLAHGRLPEAQRKYRALYAFHADRGDATGRALALHGLGDVALRQGARRDAMKWYRWALPIALDGRNPLAVVNSLMALGDCCQALEERANSAAYFDLASSAAGRLLLVHTKIAAMEKAGIALLACSKPAEAAKRWIDAKGLCEQFGCERLHRSIVDRLASLYAKAGLKTEAKVYEREKNRFAARLGADTGSAHERVRR